MAYAVEYAFSGFAFYPLNVFPLAKIRKFAIKAILAITSSHEFVLFKQRTPIKLRYIEKSVWRIFLFCQFTPPPSCILILLSSYKKNSPKWGVWRRSYIFWRRLHFRLTKRLPLEGGGPRSGGRSNFLVAEKNSLSRLTAPAPSGGSLTLPPS